MSAGAIAYFEILLEKQEGKFAREWLREAIEALKAEPCGDAVRRETVRDMFCEIHCHNERSKCAFRNICKYMNHVSALPPVTPLPDKIDGMLEDAYEHGYQQARYDYEVQPCEDAVKREAVLNTLDTMDKALDENRTVEAYKELLKECYKALPSVTPKQRTGHWVEIGDEPYDTWECDNCGFVIDGSGCVDPEEYRDIYKYCPNCGVKMEGVSE